MKNSGIPQNQWWDSTQVSKTALRRLASLGAPAEEAGRARTPPPRRAAAREPAARVSPDAPPRVELSLRLPTAGKPPVALFAESDDEDDDAAWGPETASEPDPSPRRAPPPAPTGAAGPDRRAGPVPRSLRDEILERRTLAATNAPPPAPRRVVRVPGC